MEKEKYLTEFLNYYKYVLVRANTTIHEYQTKTKLFLSWLGDTPIENVTLETLEEYSMYLSAVSKIQVSSKNEYLKIIKQFLDFLYKRNYIKNNPTDGFTLAKVPKRESISLNIEQASELLENVKNIRGKHKERTIAMVTIFLECGLRSAELIGLNLDSLDFENHKISVIGKGNKERIIYMNSTVETAIKNYLKKRPQSSNNALFIESNGRRITYTIVRYTITKCMKIAKLDEKKYTPHKLRHTFASVMYQSGAADIRSIQKILGHESIATTERYVHIDENNLRSIMENSPLNLDLRRKIV